MTSCRRHVRGVTLIEILIALLVLSFGLVGINGMAAVTVQLPKLAAYRAAAVNIATSHVEKIRADPPAFFAGDYSRPSTYDGTFNPVGSEICSYPNCTPASLARMDSTQTSKTARQELPAGGMLTRCEPEPCGVESHGHVWILWQEPRLNALIDSASSDSCPDLVINMDPMPRCVLIRFKLLVAMVVVAILAAVALPSYSSYVDRARRADARAQLLQAAQFMQRFYVANDRFDRDRDNNDVFDKMPSALKASPADGSAIYSLHIPADGVTASQFELHMVPVMTGPMAADKCGSFTYRSSGARGIQVAGLSGSVELSEYCWR